MIAETIKNTVSNLGFSQDNGKSKVSSRGENETSDSKTAGNKGSKKIAKYRKKLYGDPFVNDFIAQMEGIRYNNRPYAWIDDAGNRYSHIAGAIAMPTFEHDGYLITVGIRYDDQKMECLEEHQIEREIELIKKAAEIRDEYGPALSVFYGDPMAMMPVIHGQKKPISVAPPLAYDLDDSFQLYIMQIQGSLLNETKRLILGNCNILRNHFASFVKDKNARSKDNPVLVAAGSLVHTLLTSRPWEQAVEKVELIPTTGRDHAFMSAEEEKMVMAELYAVGQ